MSIQFSLVTSLCTRLYCVVCTVTVEVEHVTELSFPSVTICNMSPVKRSLWIERFGSVLKPAAPAAAASRRRRKRSGKTNTPFTRLEAYEKQT